MDAKTSVAEAFLPGSERASCITEEDARKRKDLTVSPKDKKWNDTLQEFRKLLAGTDMTIGQILSDKFTTHEARLFTLSQSVILRRIQKDYTLRFRGLLRERFRGITPDIPTKLTMLYFGLPIEPIDVSLAGMNYKIESRRPEPPRYVVDLPLHFLTAHKERNWGTEALIGKEDPTYPVPVELPQNRLLSLSIISLRERLDAKQHHLEIEQPSVHLRGGGADDDSDWGAENDNWIGENDTDFTYSESDGDDGDVSEDDSSQNQLEEQEKEAEDVAMQGTDSNGDFISAIESASTSQSTKWTNLYGFQGFVPFIPGDKQAYETAIRRLLSLGPQDHGAFSIVHFDEQANLVSTTCDSLPLEPDSITLKYILEKRSEGKSSPNNQHSFFVKLQHESTPEFYQPSKEQFSTSVSSVRSFPEGEGAQEADTPVSCCYLTFPNSNSSKLSQEDVYGWGADQYNAYIKTAFEVLLDRPNSHFHHAFFQLGRSNSDFDNVPRVYGLSTAASSDILSLIPNGSGKPSYLRRSRLEGNEIAFVLPGYFDTSGSKPELNGNNNMAKALDLIRYIIRSAFEHSFTSLKYVRLLDGHATLGPDINRHQEYYSIRMYDELPLKSEIGYSSALSKISAAGNPFVILHPEWEKDDNVLYMLTSDEEDRAEHHVTMPSLSSTVDDFKASVFQLMELAGCEPSRVKDVKVGDAFISVQPIQPRMGNEPSYANIEMPCFFIGPNTTDDEWFSIRAKIITPTARVRILDSKAWNWRDQVKSTDIWGPRYGLVTEAQAAVKWSEKEEAAQDTTHEFIEDTTQEPVGVEALRALLREKELLKTTHAEPANTQYHETDAPSGSDVRREAWAQQPSIFENYGLRPWPANSGIQFPMYEPPAEHMFRTGHRMPMVSKAILTPTEQAKLREAFWEMRRTALNRTAMRQNDSSCVPDQQATKKQPESLPPVSGCMPCSKLDGDVENIYRHLRENHKNELLEALGVVKTTFERTSQELQQKEAVGFCDRCGRNGDLCNESESAHHGAYCKPRIFNGAKYNFCTVCGETVWQSATDARKSGKSNGQLNHCSHKVDDIDGPHCSSCGFDTSRLPQDGRNQHQKGCKGFSAVSGRFCLYCGEEFKDNAAQAAWDRNNAHMIACYNKNQNDKARLPLPDSMAYLQQQNNLLLQVTEARFNAIDSDERERNAKNEAILVPSGSEGEQDPEEMDLDDSDEESAQPEPTTELQMENLSQKATDSPADSVSIALRDAMLLAGVKNVPQGENLDPDTRRHNEEVLYDILFRSIPKNTVDEQNSDSPRMIQIESPGRPASPDPMKGNNSKEFVPTQQGIQEMARSPELGDSESSDSEPDNGSDFENEQDEEQSDEEASENEIQRDPSSKRRKRGGKKRGRKGDRDYKFSDDEDDDEDSGSDEDGKRVKPPRRSPSPNWQKVLGPDDPEFEPTDDFYCSKCFRKAPKKHKRDRSPLGRTKEIELHYDSSRCCGIRRGIGSTKRLPNRSGWIPAADMPKPLGDLRKRFLRKYPAYARTVYPLNASNANGSYYRSDPNKDDNKGWWDIPWPPFRGPSPLPNGWKAPDVTDVPVTGKARKQFKLRSEGDSTYVQEKNIKYSDDEDIESDKDMNGKRKRKSRPSSALNSRHATPTPAGKPQKAVTKTERAATPAKQKKETMQQKASKAKAATLRKAKQKNVEAKVPTRRSTRKRQKTG
ncbi:hypothetical protein TrVFT333_003441 [Trichoderma virens FT-333]|nr:hypothetical protein TrVFT333_003441 [Trichoderma virens FT-333]